jgi:hypothetical protein
MSALGRSRHALPAKSDRAVFPEKRANLKRDLLHVLRSELLTRKPFLAPMQRSYVNESLSLATFCETSDTKEAANGCAMQVITRAADKKCSFGVKMEGIKMHTKKDIIIN